MTYAEVDSLLMPNFAISKIDKIVDLCLMVFVVNMGPFINNVRANGTFLDPLPLRSFISFTK